MLPAHKKCVVLFRSTLYMHTPLHHKHTQQPLDGTEAQSSLWEILSPVALHISRAPSFIASPSTAACYSQSRREIVRSSDLARRTLLSVSRATLLTLK